MTAQRRAEDAQLVPEAITPITAAGIESLNIHNVSDLVAAAPNLQVSVPIGNSMPIISIRGVSMSDYSTNQSSPIAVYSDEAYLGPSYVQGLTIFDTERIEVLRGPQGTLYGRNSTGGAINFISPTPDLSGPASGYVTGGYGNYDLWSGRAALATPIIEDTLSVRLAVEAESDDGYYENLLGGGMAQTQDEALRLTVHARPAAPLDIVFRYTWGYSNPISAPPRSEGEYPEAFSGYVTPAGYGYHEGEINYVGRDTAALQLATLTTNLEISPAFTLTSVSANYLAWLNQKQDSDGSPLSLLQIQWLNHDHGGSEDLRLTSHLDGPWDFIAGVYYSAEDVHMENIYGLYQSGVPVISALEPAYGALLDQYGVMDQRLNTFKSSWALYTQSSFKLNDRFSTDAGLRYTDDDDQLTYVNISRYSDSGIPIGSWVPGNISGIDSPLLPPADYPPNGVYLNGPFTLASGPTPSVNNSAVTGRLSFNYTPVTDVLTYLSYDRGYRGGSFNAGVYYTPRPTSAAYAQPETVDAFELGLKSEVLEHRLRLNAALFHYIYRNQQFVNVINGVSNVLVNAPRSTINGAELEVTARPIQRLTLGGSLGLLHTKFDELSLANTQSGAGEVDLSGNSLISAPTVSTTGNVDYAVPVDAYSLEAHADADYRSKQWFSAYNNDIGYGSTSQGGYTLFDSRLRLVSPSGRYSTSLWGKNLLNKNYDVYAINLKQGFGFVYNEAGPPRRFGIEFSANY